MPSFLAVTGDKEELWLVETVGVLVIAIGVALLTTQLDPLPVPIVAMGVVAAAGLATIDVVYVVKQVILPVYLADALIEILITICWIVAWSRAVKRSG